MKKRYGNNASLTLKCRGHAAEKKRACMRPQGASFHPCTTQLANAFHGHAFT